MHNLRPALAVVLLAALAGGSVGCGGPAEIAPEQLVWQLDSNDEGRAEEAVRALAKQGAARPERVVPLLIARLIARHEERASIGARVTPDLSAYPDEEERNEAVILLTRGTTRRLQRAGFSIGQVRQEGLSVEAYVLPPADPALTQFVRDALVAELSRSGGFSLRAEVPPPFATTPERPVSPWQGDAASYAAWLAEDQARWAAAKSAGAYQPSRADVELVAVVPGLETTGQTQVALRGTGADLPQLGDQDLRPGLRDDPVHGTPSLYLIPSGDNEAQVRAFYQANAGLTLWLVVDGKALLPLRLPGTPGVAVTFPVSGETPEQARARASAYATRITAGRYPFAVKVELLPSATVVDASDPICRALVRTGPAAEAALEALAAKDPAFAALVEKLKEGILQTRTE